MLIKITVYTEDRMHMFYDKPDTRQNWYVCCMEELNAQFILGFTIMEV